MIELYRRRHLPSTKNIFTLKTQFPLIICGICNALWGSGLFYAAKYCVQSHTSVLHNMQGIFIVLINLIMGIKPVRQEYYGVVCVIVGCTAMISDPKAVRTDGVEASVFIYAIAFFTCMFGAIFFLVSSKNLK
jgi:hypothetical protein